MQYNLFMQYNWKKFYIHTFVIIKKLKWTIYTMTLDLCYL
jgi:hypothetical protein